MQDGPFRARHFGHPPRHYPSTETYLVTVIISVMNDAINNIIACKTYTYYGSKLRSTADNVSACGSRRNVQRINVYVLCPV